MKYSEISKMSEEQLLEAIASEKEALNRMKFAHALSPVENPMRIREARKHIARLETALAAIA
jgi:large subunit ribosomal protein L29